MKFYGWQSAGRKAGGSLFLVTAILAFHGVSALETSLNVSAV